MTHNELWLTYHQVSRCNRPATAQLIELEFQNHRLLDLEDVLDHLFRQGFIEAKYRSVSFWENHEGHRVSSGHLVEELLKNGAGKCPQTAIRLVIGKQHEKTKCLLDVDIVLSGFCACCLVQLPLSSQACCTRCHAAR